MPKQNHSALFASLDALLSAEKRALLEGDIGALAEIGAEKARLLDALEHLAPEDRAPLQALQVAAGRNQVLMESALAGIQDVAERMSLLRQVRDSLQTYDAKGQKSDVYLASPGRLEKRA
ncbi:hypothetical protein [Shimia aestuarii]|uniref:hypothetical protein n=1 Tax=Shimia aestuarii TaxID=254406 RepID=UPI001FB421A1|nr:hypothetical protein [Shimia aestuarii]